MRKEIKIQLEYELRQQWLARSPAYDPALIKDADRIQAELSRDQHYGAAHLIPRLLRALRDSQAEVAQLRTPVVERNEQIEHWRMCVRTCPWTLQPRHFAELLSAYDALAQQAARAIAGLNNDALSMQLQRDQAQQDYARCSNAREAIAAEMRGLRERLSAETIAENQHFAALQETRERERQLREALTNCCQLIDGFKNSPEHAGCWSEWDESVRVAAGKALSDGASMVSVPAEEQLRAALKVAIADIESWQQAVEPSTGAFDPNLLIRLRAALAQPQAAEPKQLERQAEQEAQRNPGRDDDEDADNG